MIMKRIIPLLLIFLFYSGYLESQELPRFQTKEEKAKTRPYVPVAKGFTVPPSYEPRTMAEWEELQGILITWDDTYKAILAQIVDYAQEEGMVYIICESSTPVTSYLNSQGIPIQNIAFITAPTNAFWVRDYGPISIYEDYTENLSLVDWKYYPGRPLDDAIPGVVADYFDYPLYQTISSPYDLTNYGGNFMSDGQGTGFSTFLIYDHNPGKSEAEINNTMQKFNGIDPYIKLESLPKAAIDHIDMYMKLLDEETILVGEYDDGVSGSENNAQIEENIDYILNNFSTCYGRDYKIERIPMPPLITRYGYLTQRTYTNSIIVNKTILVPIYGISTDATALNIYRNLMPGYNVVGINCDAMIHLAGAIHCITMELGREEPIFISYPKIREVSNTGPYKVEAKIITESGVSNCKLYWSVNPVAGYYYTNMGNTSEDMYTAYIPINAAGKDIYYYISATSNSGRTVTRPLTAPDGYTHFKIPGNASCPPALNLTNETIASGMDVTFQAQYSVIAGSGFVLQDNTDVNLRAGYTIKLLTGFKASTGSNMKAYLASCQSSALKSVNYMNYIAREFPAADEKSSVLDQKEFDQSNNRLVSLYPNPTSGMVNISFNDIEGEKQVIVYSLSGSVVTRITTISNHIEMNLSSQAKGVYLIRIIHQLGSEQQKLIIR